MTLIDGDRIITAQLYDDEHEEFTEKKMSIIDFVNAYSCEGVTEADVVERLPSVEPEMEPWKWICECDAEGEGDNLYRCEKCNVRVAGRPPYDIPNYCPKCGAKMVETQESEETDADSD